MKVIAINGSPRKNGNTSILIKTVFEILEEEGIETEEINVGVKQVKGCIACMKCWENKDEHCAINNDQINELIDKMKEADGIILASPVYCADLSAQLKAFIDRVALVACANGLFQRKVGAAIVAVRRAGALSALNSINAFFGILGMITIGSTYWNMGYGMNEGEVSQDKEGLQTMRNLAKNMAWVLKSLEEADLPEPNTTIEEMTNFIK